MAKVDKIDNKDKKIEKVEKKIIKSSYSKKKKGKLLLRPSILVFSRKRQLQV